MSIVAKNSKSSFRIEDTKFGGSVSFRVKPGKLTVNSISMNLQQVSKLHSWLFRAAKVMQDTKGGF